MYNLHHTLYLFCPCENSLTIFENISGLMKNLKNIVKKKIDEKYSQKTPGPCSVVVTLSLHKPAVKSSTHNELF